MGAAAAQTPAALSADEVRALGEELFAWRQETEREQISTVCPAVPGGRGALLLTAFVNLDEAIVEKGARLIVQCASDFNGQARDCHPAVSTFNVEVLEVPLVDHPSQPVDAALDTALPVIAAARARGENVVVNCVAGISRSVTVVLAHLIEPLSRGGEGWTLQQALRSVRTARPRAGPNLGFICALLRREAAQSGVSSVPTACLIHHPFPDRFSQHGKAALGDAAVNEGLRLFRGEALVAEEPVVID